MYRYMYVKKAGIKMTHLFQQQPKKSTTLNTKQIQSGHIIYCISTLGYIPLSKIV